MLTLKQFILRISWLTIILIYYIINVYNTIYGFKYIIKSKYFNFYENIENVKGLNVLIFSSLIFISNCLTCFIYKEIIHSILFFLLTCTSIAVHYNDNIITNVLDKIIIGFIFMNGLKLFLLKKNKNIFIIFTFLFVVFVYIYGYINNKYVFDNNNIISKQYHFLMHLIGSIGHHLLVFF